VVVGRVGRLGDVVVVDVELIDTGDGSQLWSAQYKEKASDILATQREITSRISGNLRPRLSGDQHRELVKRYTQDAEAYRLYLQGRFYLNKRTAESVKIALDLFQQAVQRDARYAPAHVGISDCYQSLIEYNALPIKEGFQHAKSAVLRALELDETLGEAHASLGFIRLLFDWDWSGAEQGFRRAIELNPEYAMAHQWYGVYNVARGKFDEGIAETRRAIDLEPSSTILNSQLARALYFAGRYDAAIEQARKTSVLDPAYPSPYVYSGQSHIQKGMYAEGIALLEHAQTIAPDRDEVVAALGHAYAAAGKRDRALAIIKRLTVAGPRQSDTSYRVAMIYAGLGEKELALSSLQEAYEESDASMSTRLKVDPVLAGLHKDPRFKELLRSIGN
jgi:tetratricopeptide (TPR) repeat protein